MKTINEYLIVDKTLDIVYDKFLTREAARREKRESKAEGYDVKILQRKYELKEEREIR